jgi:hypothetical protein
MAFKNTATLVEQTFADAMVAIERAVTLIASKRTHWTCSLRIIAKALDRPPEMVPARWTAVRMPISRLHHARLNMTSKTLANHRANVGAALRWYCEAEDVPPRGTPLSGEWTRLREHIKPYRVRANLSALMRFCSGRGIAPLGVDEGVVDEFMAYRAATTACDAGSAARRRIARTWNGCLLTIPGWPAHKLNEPPPRSCAAGPAWEDFPPRLREDVETYLASLGQVRRGPHGRRLRPCKPSTVRVRKAKLIALARKMIFCGAKLDELQSMSALLRPDRVEQALEAYWMEGDERSKIYTIELATLLVGIAKGTRCLPMNDIERLEEMRADLEHHRTSGLTDKNLSLIRHVLTPGTWASVVSLPWHLMRRAQEANLHAPTKAAVLAQLAVAVGILTVAPVRLGNLTTIDLVRNLIRPGRAGTALWLVFPEHDVKNRIRLEFPLSAHLTALIDEYTRDHLPALLRGRNGSYLFPGLERGHRKSPNAFNVRRACALPSINSDMPRQR